MYLSLHHLLCTHLPTLLRSQAADATRIMFTAGKRAQLVFLGVPLVTEITQGQERGIKGLPKLLHLLHFLGRTGMHLPPVSVT